MIRIAKALADGRVGARKGRPNQDELRRAVSTAYYALFVALASAAADLFVGTSAAVRRSPVWIQTYRSLEHGFAKQQCNRIGATQSFDAGIVRFAEAFVIMQEKRHDADYNPAETFYRSTVHTWVGQVEQALSGFRKAPRADRRAFLAFVIHRTRRN